MTHKPNIVFVLTDDQGYGDLGCLGNPVIKTPNMDKLHAESVRLTNYHCGPTCAPTRAGLFTGHFHNSAGVWHTIGGRSLLRRDELSMADAFAGAGYRTGLFGKWHLGDNRPYRPQDRGFQDVVTHGGGGVGNTPDYWGNNYNNDHYAVNGRWQPFKGYCTEIWFAEATRFIERNRDRPFLCFVTTNAPHDPYIVASRYSAPYVGRVEHKTRADFYGMISCVDEHLGALRSRIDELGLARNTIVIFMTDNGTSGGVTLDRNGYGTAGYNAGMRGLKGSQYEGGHRVPFFMHWPAGGFTGGREIAELTAYVDIMPTLLDLCGLSTQGRDFDGTSLAPLLRGKATNWPDRAIVTDSQRVAHPIKWRKSATMTQQWRLIDGAELYDILKDPEQRNDVAGEHPDVVKRLREEYEKWWTRVSRQFDGTIPIPLPAEEDETVLLNALDWRNDPVRCPWNQCLVRAGMVANGYWEIEVPTSSTYRLELRRWPREEDHPITSAIPGEILDYDIRIKDGYGGGKPIQAETATLQVGRFEDSKPIGPTDKAILFEADLAAGETRLQTTFTNKSGRSVGAYYVYVTRVVSKRPDPNRNGGETG